LFLRLLAWTESWREFSVENPDGLHETGVRGAPRAPTAMLLLGVLRILGSGTCLVGIVELAGVSQSTIDKSLHQSTRMYTEWLFSEYVHMPEYVQNIFNYLSHTLQSLSPCYEIRVRNKS
jgi:hypothetical protein